MAAATAEILKEPVDPTTETLAEYKTVLEAVVAQLRKVKRLTERYPVYLLMAGNAYRFDSPDEVDAFVTSLRRKISDFESPTGS